MSSTTPDSPSSGATVGVASTTAAPVGPDRLARLAGGLMVTLLLGLLALRGFWVAGHTRALAPVGGGDAAPAFHLPLLAGGEFTLQRGEVTVIDFWATWCPPCREALPHVDALHRKYQGRGVKIVAVDAEEPAMLPHVQALANRLGLTLPIAIGGEEVSGLYKVNSLPTTVIVGKDGAIARVLIGGHSEEELGRLIDHELGQAPAAD